MARIATNKNLHKAKKSKQDEFYTQLSDIEREVKHYKDHFKDKVVLCNCDDPRVSNFFHYFSYNFEQLGLKKLIATCYKNQNADLFSEHTSERAVYLEYTGDKNKNSVPDPAEIGIQQLNGDGDFRSTECVELLKQADIVVTNPPFSLFREHVAQLVAYDKKFLVVGTWNAITYKEIFKLIKENKLWIGEKPKEQKKRKNEMQTYSNVYEQPFLSARDHVENNANTCKKDDNLMDKEHWCEVEEDVEEEEENVEEAGKSNVEKNSDI